MIYPKSRLPGPAVRLFDLEEQARIADPDATVRGTVSGDTVDMPPEMEWILTDECRE